jgi:hypothetical protein
MRSNADIKAPIHTKKKIIMVMGVQRSGTTVLLESLGMDETVKMVHEYDDDFFDNYFLRPLSEIKEQIDGLTKLPVLKPISETKFRRIEDVLQEYRDFSVWIVWIYRDPVNVYYSQVTKWGFSMEQVASDWNIRNAKILSALAGHEDRIAIVRYEDIISSVEVFKRLCEYLGVAGTSLFRSDSAGGRNHLCQELIQRIENGTSAVLSELDRHRRFTPEIPHTQQ